jgi:hypothetical protein
MARTGIVIEDGKQAGVEATEEKTVGNPFAERVTKTVRFWSDYSSHQVAVSPGKNLKFSDHLLELEANDPNADKVRKIAGSHIRELIDEPFKKEDELARFNKFLTDIVFSGENNSPSKSGAAAVQSMLRRVEDAGLVNKAGVSLPNLLVMRILKTKSFREGI